MKNKLEPTFHISFNTNEKVEGDKRIDFRKILDTITDLKIKHLGDHQVNKNEDQVLIIRPTPNGIPPKGFKIKLLRPGTIEMLFNLETFTSIEEALSHIKNKADGRKLLYISNKPNTSYENIEEMKAGPSDITFEPHLTREKAREIFQTMESYSCYFRSR